MGLLTACAPMTTTPSAPSLEGRVCRERVDVDGDRVMHERLLEGGVVTRERQLIHDEEHGRWWVGEFDGEMVRAYGWELHPSGTVAAVHQVSVPKGDDAELDFEMETRPFRSSVYYDAEGHFERSTAVWQQDIFQVLECGREKGRLRWCAGVRADYHEYPHETVYEWSPDGTLLHWVTDRFARSGRTSRTMYVPIGEEVDVREDTDLDGIADVELRVTGAAMAPPDDAPDVPTFELEPDPAFDGIAETPEGTRCTSPMPSQIEPHLWPAAFLAFGETPPALLEEAKAGGVLTVAPKPE